MLMFFCHCLFYFIPGEQCSFPKLVCLASAAKYLAPLHGAKDLNALLCAYGPPPLLSRLR